MEIIENKPLAPLTTFKIGGEAQYFAQIVKKQDLEDAFRFCEEQKCQAHIFGGGSNLLVSDRRVEGLVLQFKNTALAVNGEKIKAESGAMLSDAVRTAVQAGLSGLEWAAGIPGTVGGAIRGNAGAFGGRMSECISEVEAYDRKTKKFIDLDRDACRFAYRGSRFKAERNLLIWSADLQLQSGDPEKIKTRMEEFISRRLKRQPAYPSAGSVFKNFSLESLILENPDLAEDAKRMGAVTGGMVPAGWIIDLLDLKGKTVGGAKISDEHANFIVNTGKAKASDVIALISMIKQQARDRYKIKMDEEIEYFGF